MSRPPPASPRNLDGAPIFVHGLLQRSGTNFVTQLLALHPDVSTRQYIIEDFLLKHSHLLERYRDAVVGDWSTNWHVPAAEGQLLLRSLGDGLTDWLTVHAPGKRVVTKTPNVLNLALFPQLFPEAVLVVVIRDGRAVVESGVRSFDWNYRRSMSRWAGAVDRVLDFERSGSKVRYLRVRYEDLVNAPAESMRVLLQHCGLDPASYDFEAAGSLPVIGSSETRTNSARDVHWRPVPRPADFDPRSRYQAWDAHRMATFNRLAGPQLLAMGYETVPAKPSRRLSLNNNTHDLLRAVRRRWRVWRWGPINRRELVDSGKPADSAASRDRRS